MRMGLVALRPGGIFPRPGIEPRSPALVSAFLSTVPPGSLPIPCNPQEADSSLNSRSYLTSLSNPKPQNLSLIPLLPHIPTPYPIPPHILTTIPPNGWQKHPLLSTSTSSLGPAYHHSSTRISAMTSQPPLRRIQAISHIAGRVVY